MGKRSFFDNVREWIGNLAFAVLLWSLRKTADEYYDMLELNAAHLPNGAEKSIQVAPCQFCGGGINFPHREDCRFYTR